MLSETNRAILLMAQTKSSKDKPKSVCDSHTSGEVRRTSVKEKGQAQAMVKPEGTAEWVRFKAECVLLKGRGK